MNNVEKLINQMKKEIEELERDIHYVGSNTSVNELNIAINRRKSLIKDLEKKYLKEECTHPKTFSYNHGYHTKCEICGEEV